jgi:hypothetical protein
MAADGLREAEDSHARNLLRFRLAVAIAAALALLTACQNPLDVSVANRCERAIETNVDSFQNREDLQWVRISPGARQYVASVHENATRLYVLVRTTEGITPSEFNVAVADLSKPPPGVDDDVEIVLEGDRCPAATLAGRDQAAGNLVMRHLVAN